MRPSVYIVSLGFITFLIQLFVLLMM